MFITSLLVALGATAASAACATSGKTAAISCPVVLDGRVPSAFTLAEFDTANALFNPNYTKGNNVLWSDALLFPAGSNSRFDSAQFKSLEVTINNASIFQKQFGFRRAGLQFVNDSSTNSSGYVGVKTLHWSVKTDSHRALNLSHEYLNVWHESADYSADQIMFQTGKMIDQPTLDANAWKIFNRNNTLLWSTPVLNETWQNFAVMMDIDANTVKIYYSNGTDALVAVTEALSADLSGMGQYQLGILKKPTGTSDVVNSGYQEAPFEEGLIYGSVFVEDSTNGCISL